MLRMWTYLYGVIYLWTHSTSTPIEPRFQSIFIQSKHVLANRSHVVGRCHCESSDYFNPVHIPIAYHVFMYLYVRIYFFSSVYFQTDFTFIYFFVFFNRFFYSLYVLPRCINWSMLHHDHRIGGVKLNFRIVYLLGMFTKNCSQYSSSGISNDSRHIRVYLFILIHSFIIILYMREYLYNRTGSLRVDKNRVDRNCVIFNSLYTAGAVEKGLRPFFDSFRRPRTLPWLSTIPSSHATWDADCANRRLGDVGVLRGA